MNLCYEFNALPCPFCGGVPFYESFNVEMLSGKYVRHAHIYCQSCRASTRDLMVDDKYAGALTPDKVVFIWNRRFNQGKTG